MAATEKTAVSPALTARLTGSEVMTGAGGSALEGLMVRVALDRVVPHELLINTSTEKLSGGSSVVARVKPALVCQPVSGIELKAGCLRE